MPDFILTAPDGSKYKVTAPDEATAYNTFKRATSPPASADTYKEPPITLEPGERVLSVGNEKGDKLEAAPNPLAQQGDTPLPGMGESMARGAYQGLTFDLGDRIAALEAASGLPEAPAALGPINTLYNATRLSSGVGRKIAETLAPHIFGEGGTQAYNAEFEKQRAANDLAREANPKAYLAGSLAGGLATVPFAPELAPFKAAKIANAVRPAVLSVPKLAANAITAGAGYGALTGAAQAPDLTDLPDVAGNAATGAVTGAVLGPAIALGTRGISNVAGVLRKEYLSRVSPQKLADEMAQRKLRADAQPNESALDVANRARAEMQAAQAQPVPQPLTLADVAGEKTRSLAGTITRDPNEGGSQATKFLEQRHGGVDPFDPDALDSQKARINLALGDMLGSDRVRQVSENIIARRAAKSKPLFEAAEAKQIPYDTPEGKKLLYNLERIPLEAKNYANARLQANDLSGNQLIWRQVGKKLKMVAVPNVRRYKYIKEALDHIIDGQYDVKKGGYTPMGRDYIRLKKEILAGLDKVVPEYGAARKEFAGESELLGALRAGREFNGKDHDLIAHEISQLGTKGEKEMYRIGASEALRTRVNKAPFAADSVKQIFNSPDDVKKIREIAPDPASFDAVKKFLAQESGMFKTGAKAIAGSDTARRLTEDAGAGGEKLAMIGKMAAQAHSGYIWGFMHGVGQMLSRVNPEHRSAVMDAARKVVLNPDPQAVSDLITRLEKGAKSETDRIALIHALEKGFPRGAIGVASSRQRSQ